MTDWQPIGTAPRDGTKIIVCDTGVNSKFDVVYDGTPITVRWKDDAWEIQWDGSVWPENEFQYWMPLPELPRD